MCPRECGLSADFGAGAEGKFAVSYRKWSIWYARILMLDGVVVTGNLNDVAPIPRERLLLKKPGISTMLFEMTQSLEQPLHPHSRQPEIAMPLLQQT